MDDKAPDYVMYQPEKNVKKVLFIKVNNFIGLEVIIAAFVCLRYSSG